MRKRPSRCCPVWTCVVFVPKLRVHKDIHQPSLVKINSERQFCSKWQILCFYFWSECFWGSNSSSFTLSSSHYWEINSVAFAFLPPGLTETESLRCKITFTKVSVFFFSVSYCCQSTTRGSVQCNHTVFYYNSLDGFCAFDPTSVGLISPWVTTQYHNAFFSLLQLNSHLLCGQNISCDTRSLSYTNCFF